MFKRRKEGVSKLHIDWVAKGFEPSKGEDGALSSGDTSPDAIRLVELDLEDRKDRSIANYMSEDSLRQPEESRDFSTKKAMNKARRKHRAKKHIPPSVSQQEDEGGLIATKETVAAENEESHVIQLNDIDESGNSVAESQRLRSPENHNEQSYLLESNDASASGSGQKQFLIEQVFMEQLREPVNELGLSQCQLELNKQEQQDEMVALQAIYEDDFVTLAEDGAKPYAFSISIYVENPGNLNIIVKLPSNSRDEKPSSCSNNPNMSGKNMSGKLHACTLRYLPPIQLMCSLPTSYPSHTSPQFAIWARWLSPMMLSSLCKGLDNIWEEQPGQVVVYAWSDWLHRSALLYLGISDELELSLSNDSDPGQDSRAISGYNSPVVDIQWLIRYNEERRNEEFCNAVHLCSICFIEQTGKNFVCLSCKHFFCYACMKEYSAVHVKEGTVNKLHCPDTCCKGSIPPFILKELLEEEAFQRWEKLLLQKTLDSMTDIVYCPRCEMVCIEQEDHHVLCGRCFFSFCSMCRGSWHIGQACLSAESRLRILQERQKGLLAGEEQRRKERELVNELLSLKYVQREAKQCPSCKIAIAKTEGCNKITCGNCGQYFCYLCNKAIEGYEHFSEGCKLFEQEEIQNWERMMNDRQREVQARVELFPNLGRPCPNCGQLSAKEGNNNHIFCWSCQKHYCALCKKIVRRSSEHYGTGPNKCRQHTID